MTIASPIGFSSGTRSHIDRVAYRVRIGLALGFGSPVPVPDPDTRFSNSPSSVYISHLHLQRHLGDAPSTQRAGAGKW